MFVKKMLATLCASLALGTAAHAAQSFYMVVPLSNAPAKGGAGGSATGCTWEAFFNNKCTKGGCYWDKGLPDKASDTFLWWNDEWQDSCMIGRCGASEFFHDACAIDGCYASDIEVTPGCLMTDTGDGSSGSGAEPPMPEPPELLPNFESFTVFAPGEPGRNVWVATPWGYDPGVYGVAAETYISERGESWQSADVSWKDSFTSLNGFPQDKFAAKWAVTMSDCPGECPTYLLDLTESGTITNADGSGFNLAVAPPTSGGQLRSYFSTKEVGEYRLGGALVTAKLLPITLARFDTIRVFPTLPGATLSDMECAANHVAAVTGMSRRLISYRGGEFGLDVYDRASDEADRTGDKVQAIKLSQAGHADQVITGGNVTDLPIGSTGWNSAYVTGRVPAALPDGTWAVDVQNNYGAWSQDYLYDTRTTSLVTQPTWEQRLNGYQVRMIEISYACPGSETFCDAAGRMWLGEVCIDLANP